MESKRKPRTGQEPGIDRGYRLICDAARLMRRCGDYLTDRQATEQDWKIYYAVDLDVITLFMAPDLNSPYAAVFDHDSEDPATRNMLARLIGDFIVCRLKSAGRTESDKDSCLFIIPPHDEELGRMIFALCSRLVGDLHQSVEKLETLFAKIPDQLDTNDSTELTQWLIDYAPTLIEIFDGKSGPRSELDRFEALPEGRLLNVEQYLEQSEWAFPLPELDENKQDLPAFTEQFSAWRKRLIENKTGRQTDYQLIRDAYVLATLESVNRQMAADTKTKRRLVLITGTQGILKAAATYRIPALNKARSASFGDLYVRHPQAFMAHEDFFVTNTSDGSSKVFRLVDWLNLFFPRVFRGSLATTTPINNNVLASIEEQTDPEFREAVMLLARSERPSEDRSTFPESMLEEWRTQVRVASVARRIGSSEGPWHERAQELLKWIMERRSKTWTLAQLHADITSRAIKSLSALYSSTVWLGLWGQLGTLNEQVRGIPALRFDPEYEPARDYCRLVVTAMIALRDSAGTGQSRIDLADMYARLSQVDESHYHGHVIHALAYATKGHWYATRTLCRLALQTVDALPPETKGFRKGREAAYLLAITERRLARKIDDLQLAIDYLSDARRRENDGATPDLRFWSEEIAIDVARINFEYFPTKKLDDVSPTLLRICIDASRLLDQLEAREDRDCHSWIRQQVCTNALDLALVAYSADRTFLIPVRGYIDRFLDEMKRQPDLVPPDRSHADALSDFIKCVATVVFSSAANERASELKKLDTLRFPCSLPFDETREKLFRQLAKESGVSASATADRS